MTLLQLQHQLDGPDWRETVLRYALYSSFVGLVFFLFAFRIFAFSQNQLISTLILGFPTILGSLLFLQLGHRRAAVWFYLIGANVGEAILSIQQGNPNHIVPLSATIVAIVIISVTGSPLQTCVTGLLSILINLTVTWLLLDGRWLPFSDVVWSESFTSIGVYLSILIPLVATSWIITVIINQLQDQNDKLQRETRARIERELHNQINWFRKVIDGSPDIFVVFDEYGKLTDINETGLVELGYTRAEIIGMPISELDADWSAERMQEQARTMQQHSKQSAIVQGRNQRKDGSIFPVEVASSLLMDDDKRRRVGFIRNITDRLEAEKALQESEEKYRNLYNQSPVMMHSVSANGELIDVNDYWTQVMNYSRDEVLNTPIARYFTQQSMQKALEVDMPAYFPQGHAENLAYQMVKKEGEIIDVSFSAINQFDKDGEFSHAQATVIDVTAEKALDRALQESEEKFRSIFNTTPVGMYLINAEGFLTDINDRWLEMTGYRREEMIGQRSVDFLTPGSRKQALEVDFPNFFKRGYIKNLEIEVMRKDGTILDILLNGSIRKNEEGEYDGAIASLVDITEQNRLRAAVAHTERRFQAVFNNTFSFIGLMEPDGTLIEANEAAYSFGNLTPEEVLGVPFWEALWWQHSPQVQIDLRNAIQIAAKGDFVRYEVDVQGGDGQLETIDFSIKPIFDEEGNVNLLVPEGRMITTLKQTEAKLIQSEKRFRALFNDSSDFTLALSPEGVVQDANDRVDIGTILGRDGFMGRYLWDAAPFDNFPQTGRTLHEMYLELISDNVSTRREIMMASRIHGDLYLDIIMTPIFDESNNHLDMIIVEARDVTSLVQTREALRQSADDNQVLLKEVHHRVKNNLQIIISMLRTHIRSSPDEAIQISYREIMSRVQSMSLIHQQLYQKNSDLDDIELDLYMHQLLKEIMRTYKIPIDLHIDVAAIKLDIDRALTCGLIVNELATNALKYAFPERRGSLSITGRQKNGKIMLEVADDGIGLDPEIKLEHATSTGFQLIYLMKQQLAGELSIFRNNGTHFRLTFPYLATG